MADLDALEAALDAESNEELTYDTGGSSAEVIRRLGKLEKFFLAGKLEGSSRIDFEVFVPDVKHETTVLLNRGLACGRGLITPSISTVLLMAVGLAKPTVTGNWKGAVAWLRS
jgi:hypothetical protein